MSSDKNKNTSISWADLAKKIVYTSLGSAALAKDAVKETKFHKEILNGIISRAEQSKEDIMEILAREVSKFLSKINVSEEISKALQGLVINLNASIDFKKKQGAKGISPSAIIHSASTEKKK